MVFLAFLLALLVADMQFACNRRTHEYPRYEAERDASDECELIEAPCTQVAKACDVIREPGQSAIANRSNTHRTNAKMNVASQKSETCMSLPCSEQNETRRELAANAALERMDRQHTTGTSCAQNYFLAKRLEELGTAYGARGDRWRSWQLVKAARLLKSWPKALTSLQDLDLIPGLGTQTKEKCREILGTGALERLHELRKEECTEVLMELTQIHGVGDALARKWFRSGVRSLSDVRARKDKLGLTRVQRLGLKYIDDFKQKIPHTEADEIVAVVLSAADKVFGRGRMEAHGCGSLRRGNVAAVSDVDIVFAPRLGQPEPCFGIGRLVTELHNNGIVTDDISEVDTNASRKSDNFELYMGVLRLSSSNGVHRRIDLVLSSREHFPFVLFQWTGSGLFLREMHKLANCRGMHLGPIGLWVGSRQGNRVPCFSEENIFTALGLPYLQPCERELDSELVLELEAARKGKSIYDCRPKLELVNEPRTMELRKRKLREEHYSPKEQFFVREVVIRQKSQHAKRFATAADVCMDISDDDEGILEILQ